MTLGQNIQAARKAKGLSQETLAEKVGVSRQALGKWEKDTALPGVDNLQALAKELGVSVDALLGCAAPDTASPTVKTIPSAAKLPSGAAAISYSCVSSPQRVHADAQRLAADADFFSQCLLAQPLRPARILDILPQCHTLALFPLFSDMILPQNVVKYQQVKLTKR